MTTTTDHMRSGPDYYSSEEECRKAIKNRKNTKKTQTNPLYSHFRQCIFHAGDESQFDEYRYSVCDIHRPWKRADMISMEKNIFSGHTCGWEKYENIGATAVLDTFRYMFHKFKKGIFVKIRRNKLKVFLPFSKHNFYNEWSDKIKVDPKKFGSISDFVKHIHSLENRPFRTERVNRDLRTWYANNCLIRYEYPVSEGDSNITVMKNMLEELCESRKIPDIEFFLNRRDFPVLTRNGSEAYNHIWGTGTPLVSHLYDKYAPILSMSTSCEYADIAMPTWEDWVRVQNCNMKNGRGKWFPEWCKAYSDSFSTEWEAKIPTAVFRGGTTGCGVTIETNPRLGLAHLSFLLSQTPSTSEGVPYLDAGITNWNLRPRKNEGDPYLRTIEIKNLPFGLSQKMSPEEQANYKYIVHVEGHVAAFRLSLELSMNVVILKVESPWKMWYSDYLEPYVHFVPVKRDLSNLIDQIKWCRNNDDKCRQIALNARLFYKKYLCKDGIFDYMQKIFVSLKEKSGMYFYNTITPVTVQIQNELQTLNLLMGYPETDKNSNNITAVQSTARKYGTFQGLRWAINMAVQENAFERVAQFKNIIHNNDTGDVVRCVFAKFEMVLKRTNDKNKVVENIHDAYVGIKGVNSLLKKIPNFIYTFGYYHTGNMFNIVSEYIRGRTLLEYLNSENYIFSNYVFILLQLCLALEVAQNKCGFVHWDLTPWNIVIQELPSPVKFRYETSYGKTITIKTAIIPVIIDYGKSHIISDSGVHHGMINPFRMSRVQDIFSILVTSLGQIVGMGKINSKDYEGIFGLVNFVSGTDFQKEKIQDVRTLKEFLHRAKKYSERITDNKRDLEAKTPMDLFDHIQTVYKFNFPIDTANQDKTSLSMNGGNGRQVFEYILSGTDDERMESFLNVFVRLKHCTLPQPSNIFFLYYAVQSFEQNLVFVYEDLLKFIGKTNIQKDNDDNDDNAVVNAFKSTMIFLEKVYRENIDKCMRLLEEGYNVENVNYTLTGNFDTLEQAPYNETVFEQPERVKSLLLSTTDDIPTDLSEYKDIVGSVLSYNGKFEFPPELREKYETIFGRLMSVSTLNMKMETANYRTIRMFARDIYMHNIEFLDKQKPDDNVKMYLTMYREILNIITGKGV